MTTPSLQRVQARFAVLKRRSKVALPPIAVVEGSAGDFPRPRDFAYCSVARGGQPITITVAPRLGSQSIARIDGVLAHEIGHALAFKADVLKHAETDADALADWGLGVRIGYDDADVQTTDPGVPRPAYLPNGRRGFGGCLGLRAHRR